MCTAPSVCVFAVVVPDRRSLAVWHLHQRQSCLWRCARFPNTLPTTQSCISRRSTITAAPRQAGGVGVPGKVRSGNGHIWKYKTNKTHRAVEILTIFSEIDAGLTAMIRSRVAGMSHFQTHFRWKPICCVQVLRLC